MTVPAGLFEGKRILVTGVLTRDSIAFHVADRVQKAGGEVILTGFGRPMRLTERAAKNLSSEVEILELDATKQEDFDALGANLLARGPLHGALHAIAFAPEDALGGNFLNTPAESAKTAFEVSAFSYKSLTQALLPALSQAEHGGSVVGLDFDASIAWPIYDWMGVAKAALESTNRYLARYVGSQNVRVNLVSAGPLNTMAARGIGGFSKLADAWDGAAPLGWNIDDPTPTADTILFLLSSMSRGISGEILHVDGGAHSSAPMGD